MGKEKYRNIQQSRRMILKNEVHYFILEGLSIILLSNTVFLTINNFILISTAYLVNYNRWLFFSMKSVIGRYWVCSLILIVKNVLITGDAHHWAKQIYNIINQICYWDKHKSITEITAYVKYI